jgi:opacity protein-like surface antigen
MRKTIVGLAMLAGLMLGSATPARAQSLEFAAGYAYLSVEDLPDALPVGWMVSASGKLANYLWIVGEVNGNYKTYSSAGADLSLSETTFLFGPRVSAATTASVSPFVQFLLGAARGAADIGVPNASLKITGTNFAIQPGAGIDFNASPNFAIRVEGDLRGVNADTGTGRQWRFVGALVFRP